MPDRENTISSLETQIHWIEDIECHQFPGWLNTVLAMRDALELLKNKEVKEVKVVQRITKSEDNGTYFTIIWYECEECGHKINGDDIYCAGCGKKVDRSEVIRDA